MGRQTAARSTRSKATRGRQPKNREPDHDQIPDVYREMLEEAEARDPAQFNSDKPIKRRRVGDTKAIPIAISVEQQDVTTEQPKIDTDDTHQVQIVYDDSATEDESDIEWENVDAQPAVPRPSEGPSTFQGGDESLEIILDKKPETRKKTAPRFQQLNGKERQLRLDTHKVHLLCLLAHLNLRNLWCNDEETQQYLNKMIPKNVMALLHPKEGQKAYYRSTSFMNGLDEVAGIFQRRFQINKPGLKRAHWEPDQDKLKERTESIMSNAEVFSSKADFRSQAKTMQGSADFGAQLFCTLLRSASVEARLVCSLQPLPFSGEVKGMTPSKGKSKGKLEIPLASPAPARKRQIGRPEFLPAPARPTVRPALEVLASPHPVFWVEAFNEAAQKWYAVDTIVTKSVAKHDKFEPPASDPYNYMNYVIAFEDDASARDVTQRYTKAYNAKTRKTRVEFTKDGEAWWKRALSTYEKPFLEDRDEAEASELTSKIASEGMPRNMDDFRGHPIYALGRHLHLDQVIYPERIIGHVSSSGTSSKNDNLEPVYRRGDVHTVRSAAKWYMLGRDIKIGEQPMKYKLPLKDTRSTGRKKRAASDDDDAEQEKTALYAEFQTEIYVPPPVVNGRIPKNHFGNIDIYVPSMVPSGGVHVKRPDAIRAAKLLGVDFALAVTGFDFKGKQGTAVIKGIVIAVEFQEALEEVLTSMEEEKLQAALEARSKKAIVQWRLFLQRLRIAERVKGYAAEDENEEDSPASAREMSTDPEEGGGGFFPEPDQPLSFAGKSGPGKSQPLIGAQYPGFEDNDASGQAAEGIGGGFIVDSVDGPTDEQQAREPAVLQKPPSVPKSNTGASRYVLVVVPNKPEAVTEAPPMAQDESVIKDQEGSSRQAPIAVDSSADCDSKSVSMEVASKPASPSQNPLRSQTPEDLDSEIEKGSLLSEDPEDEDAIPEWLL